MRQLRHPPGAILHPPISSSVPPPPAQRLSYGLQPNALPAVDDLARSIAAAVGSRQSAEFVAAARGALEPYLKYPDLLDAVHQAADPADICRHLLYAHPAGLFSILAIVWLPGQQTPIHGHTAWGIAGVYRGHPSVTNYVTCGDPTRVVDLHIVEELELKPGDTGTVPPGISQLHRIRNASDDTCITIHVYGRDLLASPRSVNIVFAE